MEGDNAYIEVFAAGNSLAPTAGGRTGSQGSLTLVAFAAWPNPVTTLYFTFWNGYILE